MPRRPNQRQNRKVEFEEAWLDTYIRQRAELANLPTATYLKLVVMGAVHTGQIDRLVNEAIAKSDVPIKRKKVARRHWRTVGEGERNPKGGGYPSAVWQRNGRWRLLMVNAVWTLYELIDSIGSGWHEGATVRFVQDFPGMTRLQAMEAADDYITDKEIREAEAE